jgi:hypothetical protein
MSSDNEVKSPFSTQQDELLPSNKPVEITNIEIKDQNTGLNVLIHYITLAQKRGVFSIQESAHIWNCIEIFISKQKSVKS